MARGGKSMKLPFLSLTFRDRKWTWHEKKSRPKSNEDYATFKYVKTVHFQRVENLPSFVLIWRTFSLLTPALQRVHLTLSL